MTSASVLPLATRASSLVGSVIDSSTSLLAEQAHDIVRFAMGSPAAEAIPSAGLAAIAGGELGPDAADAYDYAATEGDPPLREALLATLDGTGDATTADRLLITAGGMQGLDLGFKLFVDPGDLVIVESPTYTNGSATALSYQAELLEAPVDQDGLIVEQLPDLVAGAGRPPKVIYTIPTFQNPAGTTLPQDRRERIVELAAEHNVAIFEDDPYGDLQYSGEEIIPIRSLDERVLYFGTFSKTLAPGIRVGFVIAPEEVAEVILSTREVADISNDRIMMRTVHHTLADDYLLGHIDECRDFYRSRRDSMLEALEREMPESVHWSKPDGGFFIWITLPDHVDGEEMFRIAAEHGTVVFPGKWFDPTGEVCHTIRLSFSTVPEDRIRLGIERLGKAIRSVL